MKHTLTGFLIYSLVFGVCIGEEKIPIREIEVKPILKLNELQPKFDFFRSSLHSIFTVDLKGNFYFLDIPNHRILKFDPGGRFISSIGSIGQREEDLYEAVGIFLKDDIIYVLDQRGLKIKLFSINGKFISNIPIKIKNVRFADFLAFSKDFIFVSIKYNDKRSYNDKELITVFDRKGRILRKIGEVIKCNTLSGYFTFNLIIMDVIDNIIFGSFRFYPIIFAYTLDGKKILYKDLRLSVSEIRQLSEESEKMSFDKPEFTKQEWGFQGFSYCSGFCVGKNKHLYYGFGSSILRMNEKGDVLEKIILKKEGKKVRVDNLLIDQKGNLWGLGCVNNQEFFIFNILSRLEK